MMTQPPRDSAPDSSDDTSALDRRAFLGAAAKGAAALFVAPILVGCGGGGDVTGLGNKTGTTTPPTTNPPVTTTEPGKYYSRTVTVATGTFGYQVFVPNSAVAKPPYKVIVALGGSTSRGSDNNLQLLEVFGEYVSAHLTTHPTLVILPQLPGGDGAAARVAFYQIVPAAIAAVTAEWSCDTSRIYLTGGSMGGDISYELLFLMPTTFAAALICPGSCVPVTLDRLSSVSPFTTARAADMVAARVGNMPIQVFLGTSDTTGDPAVNGIGGSYITLTREIFTEFKKAGSPIIKTEYSTGHVGTWQTAYNDPNIMAWLYAQHR
ncbi:MAG: hypothetical protein ABJE47_12095 [bacterium]